MAGYIGSKAVNLSTTGADINGDANIDGDLSFRDNDKAIFGAGSDLQIFHDGSHSYISDQGTGNLRIAASDRIQFYNAATDEVLAQFITDGEAEVRYNGSTKLATTSTGIQVTGNISNASGDLTLDVAGDINLDAGGQQIFFQKGGTTFGQFGTESTPTNFTIESTVSDGDIVFKGNDGGVTTTSLTLDMSQAGRATFNEGIVLKSSTGGDFGVNINTSSGDSMKLQVVDTGSAGAANGVITVTDGDLILSPSANVGIGTSSPSADLEVNNTANSTIRIIAGTTSNSRVQFGDSGDVNIGAIDYLHASDAMTLTTNNAERMRIDSSGNVGIAATPPTTSGYTNLTVGASTTGSQMRLYGATSGFFHRIINNNGDLGIQADADNVKASTNITFSTDGSEAMRIDSSGNLLVGKTASDVTAVGVELLANGKIHARHADEQALDIRRTGTSGDIAVFRGGNSGFIRLGESGNAGYIEGATGDTGLKFEGAHIRPRDNQADADNVVDLGSNSFRFDDIYATNGTIQTSDRNEKQDIAELSDAEQRVAVAAKGLMRKFRWRDAVEAKGDEARTHFGIIAQDLQAAFAAEGLDAGDYAMFISSTWTDEETGEERTRMGVRYSELLAFIIGAL